MNHLQIHRPPLERQATCPTHGEFTAKCFYADTWTHCQACLRDEEAERQAAEQAKERAARQAAWEAKLGRSGIPERFLNRTIESFEAITEPQKAAKDFARAYAQDFPTIATTGRSALFVGRPGTGKTHLAAGIGLEVMHQGFSVLFITVQRAIRRVKDSWAREATETESQAIAALVWPDLLILDEVGVQFGSDFERNVLFDVLNERYERRLPSLLLSNLPANEVGPYLGERVVDRLREDGGRIIPFSWGSHRRK